MILETSRLILRPFLEEDIGRLAELMANHDFMRFSLGPNTYEQTQTVLQKFLGWNHAGLPSQFAVVLRENNDVLGYCGFLRNWLPPRSYALEPRFDHRSAVRDYAFVDLKLPRVISLIHPANIPSRPVAEKIGLIPKKEITSRGFPTTVFALSREQWQAAYGAG